MGNSYHNQVLETFLEEIETFTDRLNFKPLRAETNIQLGSRGEIDILLYGENQRGLIEVKSHSGLANKFKTKQFKIYREYDPEARVYLLLGDSGKSLNPKKFHLKQYWPLS